MENPKNSENENEVENDENEADNETGEINQMSITRPSLGSDGDYDDELGVPDTIQVVDMGDGPVAIENSDVELEGI